MQPFGRYRKDYTEEEMLLLIILLLLAAVVQQSFGTDEKTILSEITEEKKKDIVNTFNTLRRSVNPTASNMLKMSWSEEASETAKKWAGNCQLRQSPVEERTINGSVCGESISQAAIPKSWEEIIEKWHSTVSHFKYGIGATDPKKNIYTYTQIVWYRSHQIGCAVAYCAQSTFPFVYICHYCPGGNIMGESKTPYKEGPPCGDCLNDCEDKLCTNPCFYTDKVPNCQDIMATFTCKTKFKQQCEATCKCKTEIK